MKSPAVKKPKIENMVQNVDSFSNIGIGKDWFKCQEPEETPYDSFWFKLVSIVQTSSVR